MNATTEAPTLEFRTQQSDRVAEAGNESLLAAAGVHSHGSPVDRVGREAPRLIQDEPRVPVRSLGEKERAGPNIWHPKPGVANTTLVALRNPQFASKFEVLRRSLQFQRRQVIVREVQ